MRCYVDTPYCQLLTGFVNRAPSCCVLQVLSNQNQARGYSAGWIFPWLVICIQRFKFCLNHIVHINIIAELPVLYKWINTHAHLSQKQRAWKTSSFFTQESCIHFSFSYSMKREDINSCPDFPSKHNTDRYNCLTFFSFTCHSSAHLQLCPTAKEKRSKKSIFLTTQLMHP